MSKAIALIVDEGDDWKNVKSPVAAAAAAASPKAATPPPTTGAPAPAPATPASVTVTAATTQPLSPAVTVLVQTHHLDVSKIPATGPHGRLLKGDVLQFLEKGAAPAPAPAPASASAPAPVAVKQAAAAPASPAKPTTVQAPSYTDIPVTQIRKVIASRLQQSKFTIPHVYTTYSVDMDNAIAWRKACTEYLAKEEATRICSTCKEARLILGFPAEKVPSLNVLVIKAAAAALQRWPEVNVTVSAEVCPFKNNSAILTIISQGEAVRSASCDISFAVAMEKGLITPIVRGVERMRLGDLTREIDSLAARARAGKLKPEEYQGGSFSVSNLGMYVYYYLKQSINRRNKVWDQTVYCSDQPAAGSHPRCFRSAACCHVVAR